jgi:hypothetical protein
MTHLLSKADQDFLRQVEACEFPVPKFNHRAHLRLAYIYLVENDLTSAVIRMRNTLTALLKHAGIDPVQKYHETLTTAWLMKVYYFMKQSASCRAADEFIDQHPILLERDLMKCHYSPKAINSQTARTSFVQPDLRPLIDAN